MHVVNPQASHRRLCRLVLCLLAGLTIAKSALAEPPGHGPMDLGPVARRPLGPDELPEYLPGRWKVSVCISLDPGHAWIRFENTETGEVRTASRFHVLVGGWFDARHLRWNYGPTIRPGVYMDREQSCEDEVRAGKRILLSAYVENPRILWGDDDGHGHGLLTNNCVTYTRDAWWHYTGEYYPLPEGAHAPEALRNCILHFHPEVLPAR